MRKLFHYESRRQPLASRRRFARRLAQSVVASLIILGGSLLAGVLGYAYLESMGWSDAFHAAAMNLSGAGSVEPLKTHAGKVFAGCYAIYSGLIVVLTSGIVLAPIAHRILHRFHVDS